MDNSVKLKEYFDKAIELRTRGELFEAIELLESVLKEFPGFLPALGLLGDMYLHAGSPQLAIDPLRQVIEKSPENCNGQFLLGCALGRTAQFEEAIQHLLIADRLLPKNPEILRNMGWMYCMMGNVERGRSILLESISLKPDHALTYNDLGASYLLTRDSNFTEARKWLQKALELEPENKFIRETWKTFQHFTKGIS